MDPQVSFLGEMMAWAGLILAFGALLVMAYAVRRVLDALRKEQEVQVKLVNRLIAMSSPYPADALLKLQQSQLDLTAEQWRSAAAGNQQAPQQHSFVPGELPPDWATHEAS